jgi:hypothetical protein
VSSLISSFSILFSLYKSFTLFSFTPQYFILFEAIVITFVFLISFSELLFLLYKIVTEFCYVDFVYCFLAELIITKSYLEESLGSSKYRIILSANSDNLTSFPICISFISFSALLLWLRLLTILNKSRESGHPFFALDYGADAFIFFLSVKCWL